MARLLCSGCWRFLIIVVVAVCVPSAAGRADNVPRVARVETRSSPVATLYAALSQCRASLSERERWRVAGAIYHESQRFGYDPLFVLAMTEVESTCSPTARSARGAIGLIQVRPSIARAVAEEAGLRWRGAHMLTKAVFNIHLGLRYLAQLESQFGDPYLAVAAYNLGPTRVTRMPRQRARQAEYVQKVLARYEALLAQHADSNTEYGSLLGNRSACG
jgi:soluble lytic murein transglycosylase